MLHIAGLRMFRSYALNAFISLLCLPDCKHECVLSGEMEELPIWWSLRKRDLLRVSSSCLECSASVSFNQWKLLRDKAVSRSCLSNCPGVALFSSWSSQPPSLSSSLAFCNPFSLNSQGMGLYIDKVFKKCPHLKCTHNNDYDLFFGWRLWCDVCWISTVSFVIFPPQANTACWRRKYQWSRATAP